MARAHLGQQLTPEAIAQLQYLGKEVCRICSAIRARTTPYCSHCRCATAARPLQLGDALPDRRRAPPGEGQHGQAIRPTGDAADVGVAADGTQVPPDEAQDAICLSQSASDGALRSGSSCFKNSKFLF